MLYSQRNIYILYEFITCNLSFYEQIMIQLESGLEVKDRQQNGLKFQFL